MVSLLPRDHDFRDSARLNPQNTVLNLNVFHFAGEGTGSLLVFPKNPAVLAEKNGGLNPYATCGRQP